VDQRVEDLLARMTLEEKLAQIESVWRTKDLCERRSRLSWTRKGVFLPDSAKITLKNGIGRFPDPARIQWNGGPREMAELTNAIQKWVKENTRLEFR